MNQIFDINRTLDFAKYKAGLNRKLLLLSFLGYLALIFIISFFVAYYSESSTAHVFDYFHLVSMGIMLILGTVFMAGKSFSDMNTSEKSIGMIMIPASSFEKFIVPLISSSVGWLLVVYVSYELLALIINGLWSALFGMEFVFFNVFDFIKGKELTDMFLAYFFTHSIFFLGAAAFKKYPIAKTILAQFLLNFAYSILALIFIMVLFGNMGYFANSSENFGEILLEKGWFTQEKIVFYGRVLKILVMVVLPVLLYITAFFKFKEREV